MSYSVADIRRAISHTCDGPINTFVLISRACRMVAERQHFPELVSNALYEELQERGLLSANEQE